MIDTMSIGPTPCGEDCAQVGSDGYIERSRKECLAFVHQLIRVFGEPPEGARLVVKSNPHDFGSYLEVVVKYDDSSEAAVEYAYKLEAETPEFWDADARKELGL